MEYNENNILGISFYALSDPGIIYEIIEISPNKEESRLSWISRQKKPELLWYSTKTILKNLNSKIWVVSNKQTSYEIY